MHHTESKLGTPMSLKLRSIKNHLKERSFNSFITWRRRVCTIHDLSIFQSIVLATFTTAYSLDEFIEVLRRYSLRIKFSNEALAIKFPMPQAKDICQKCLEGNSRLKDVDVAVAKQASIMKSINSTREKLSTTMKINSLLKEELAKSKKIWEEFIDKQIVNGMENSKDFN